MSATGRDPGGKALPHNDEVDEYAAEKQQERQRQAGPAKAEKDPAWQARDHLDLTRAANKPNRDAAPDAEGQAESGAIDQTVTDKGFTQTR